MRDVEELVDGYRTFKANRYPEVSQLYRSLAEQGQSPKVLVIACVDSRADPTTIFNAGPGSLFVVRNVANLVPPFETGGGYHGTSAALEFGVTALNVETILVMGHGRCGGVKGFLEGLYDGKPKHTFIESWVKLLGPAKDEIIDVIRNKPFEEQLTALEHAGVRQSIRNLMTFPFIKERVEAGKLRLRGAFFDISDGRLMYLDPDSGAFEYLDETD